VVREVDVLIVGGGPAGSTAALNLAPTRSVLVIDSRGFHANELIVGESLAPAARRLLWDMGLLKDFEAQGHETCYGNRSVWGDTTPLETDYLRDPDGPGWHLDRNRFDHWLRDVAASRGSDLLPQVALRTLDWDPSIRCWQAVVSDGSAQCTRVLARILIDATGRHASISRRLGAQVESREPRMVCGWLNGFSLGEIPSTAGFTFVEAVEDGWWYTAPLPCERRILAFYTDADLASARLLRHEQTFLNHVSRTQHLGSILRDCGFSAGSERVHLTISNGGRTRPAAGPHWFAAGDAVIHFDPISSQGLFNALFTGLASAEAADRVLAGEDPRQAAATYSRLIDSIDDAYSKHLDACYASEERWLEHSFWARRRIRAQGLERQDSSVAVVE
jgi:flavin-dependent dehydrogenase